MANGDILACRIAANAGKLPGAVLEIDISSNTLPGAGGVYTLGLGPNNDPSTAKIVVTLTSLGYDQAGNATTITRKLYGAAPLRQVLTAGGPPWDDVRVSTTTTTRVVLNDHVYSPDTSITVAIAAGFYTQGGQANNAFSGSVTNNSTFAYPKSVGRFIWPSLEAVTGKFYPEFLAFNRFAQNGQPCACVVFTCTDGTTTITKIETDLKISTKGGPSPNTGLPAQNKPNTVLAYIPEFDAASFIQGAVLTVQAKVYPWVGNAGSLLDTSTGTAPPSELFGPAKYVCDKTGGYGGAFAVVNAGGGNFGALGATKVYASQALAESNFASSAANSYLTIGDAMQALKSYNNTNKGHNDPGGGTALLTASATWNAVTVADMGAQNTFFRITRLSTVGKAAAIVTSTTQGWPGSRLIKLEDVTISGTAVGLLVGDQTLATIWADNCTINSTGDPTFYLWKCCYNTRCDIQAISATGLKSFGSGAHSPFAIIRGSIGAPGAEPPGHAYAFVGNYNISPTFMFGADNPAADATSDGAVVAFNTHYQLSAAGINWFKVHIDAVTTVGLAIVQNVCEKNTNDTDVLTALGGDGCNGALNNIIIWHNSWAGNRFNAGYNDGTGTGGVAASFLHANWSLIGNIFENFNNKDDNFVTTNAARVGCWSVGYWVGGRGNVVWAAVNAEWKGEFPAGIYGSNGGKLSYVRDSSWDYEAGVSRGIGGAGPALGNGDYHLTDQAAAFGLMGMGTAVLPYDLDGNPRLLFGGSAGAYEKRASNVLSYASPIAR